VRPLHQIGRDATRHEAAVRDTAEPQADNSDVDMHRLHRKATLLDRPVEAFNRLAKPFTDGMGLAAFGKIGNQETEFVPAKPRVQILRSRLAARAFLREEIVRSHLFAQQRSHPLDDAIAYGMTERIVVPLEAGDIDQTNRAPAPALLEREEGFELLGEPSEVHELGFRIA